MEPVHVMKSRLPRPAVKGTNSGQAPAHGPAWQAHQAKIRNILRGPSVQAKLTVGAPNDVCGQQADPLADAVTRMPTPHSAELFWVNRGFGVAAALHMNRLGAGNGNTSGNAFQRMRIGYEDELAGTEVQRQVMEGEPRERKEGVLQSKSAAYHTQDVTQALLSRTHALRGRGARVGQVDTRSPAPGMEDARDVWHTSTAARQIRALQSPVPSSQRIQRQANPQRDRYEAAINDLETSLDSLRPEELTIIGLTAGDKNFLAGLIREGRLSLQEARFERAENDEPSSYTRAGGPVFSIRDAAVPAVLIHETAHAQRQRSDPLNQAEFRIGTDAKGMHQPQVQDVTAAMIQLIRVLGEYMGQRAYVLSKQVGRGAAIVAGLPPGEPRPSEIYQQLSDMALDNSTQASMALGAVKAHDEYKILETWVNKDPTPFNQLMATNKSEQVLKKVDDALNGIFEAQRAGGVSDATTFLTLMGISQETINSDLINAQVQGGAPAQQGP